MKTGAIYCRNWQSTTQL